MLPTDSSKVGLGKSDLQRFLDAQDGAFDRALSELRAERKRSHWMWFIFPQISGLGSSAMARRFAIRDLAEARAYLAHPVLGPRLQAVAKAALAIKGKTAAEIFAYPDDLKLRSCATLFAQVSEEGSPFQQILTAFFDGKPDARTLERLKATGEPRDLALNPAAGKTQT
jgi:uncharacterized protein (DUF1810 family)